MARRRRDLTGIALSRPSVYGFTIQGPDIVSSLRLFQLILNEEVMIAKRNLGQAAINRLESNFNQAETGWGVSRMAGVRDGVNFPAYGNTTGRNDTGNMIQSLAWDIVQDQTNTGVETKARFGWLFKFEEYFRMQEEGFVHDMKFDHARTAATGEASFMKTAPMRVEGAQAFPDAIKLVRQIKDSFYAQAFNRAKKRWFAEGRKANPGTYADARRRYESSEGR
jgi:hypothetical protein